MADDGALKTNGFNSQKVTSLKRQWLDAEEAAASAIAKANAKKKGVIDSVLEAADQMGVKKSNFRKMMLEGKHLRNAEAVRADLEAKGDQDVLDQFDNLKVAAGMPLFDFEAGRPVE